MCFVKYGQLFLVLCLIFHPLVIQAQDESTRPNFLVIVSDDQSYGTVSDFMPQTKKEIFDAGVVFENAFVTTSICCPSRASILTGMYSSRHGVLNNKYPLNTATFVTRLHAAGYYTGIVGKYLNSWDGTPRPEFDSWVSFRGGSVQYRDPELNVAGEWRVHPGYITNILADYAGKFLTAAAGKDRPFLLIFTPNAPHDPALPEEKYAELYERMKFKQRLNFNPAELTGKPEWLRALPRLSEARTAAVHKFRLNQLRTLKSLDDAVAVIIGDLSTRGQLDNTFVIYISDNGVMNGAHRLVEKNYPYEEAIHVPCAVRYPPLVKSPRTETRLVANIDVAPTVYELAKIPVPPDVQGRSWIQLLQGKPNDWRDEIYLEGWPRDRSRFVALRSARYKYIETVDEKFTELYDIFSDPAEIKNLSGGAELAGVEREFKDKLRTFAESR